MGADKTPVNTAPSLDPTDWEAFRARAHAMLDGAVDRMEGARDGRVWTPVPDDMKTDLRSGLPEDGRGGAATDAQITALLPHGVGNTHPRFFGWVHGAGTPSNVIADIAAAAMNANLGGRDHGAMYIEKQVVDWVRDLFEFPQSASGLVVSGTSIATIIALKSARDRALGFDVRKTGVQSAKLVGYTSDQSHSCVARAFDMLGLGSDALRRIPVNDAFEMDMDTLRAAIGADRAAGLHPFAVVGTVGAVNVGAIDDLEAIADIAAAESLWFHIDGAFGALGVLSDRLRDRLSGIKRADSLAFDFHKWAHVNYDAGFVLIRDEDAHRRAFSDRPDYLLPATQGLAAGNPWPVDYGPELSRGFRALKIWAHLNEHGPAKIGALITQNCDQAAYLGRSVDADASFERLAPVAMNICCFRAVPKGLDDAALDALNDRIVVALQVSGIAAPSTTRLGGKVAIRVNITNHRTRFSDMDVLLNAIREVVANHV
ncbi:MAG: pyridoxal-dependent decarboxylase [Octadecabacter sp.]